MTAVDDSWWRGHLEPLVNSYERNSTRRALMGKQQATRLSASVAPTKGNSMYISPLS